MSDLTPDLLLHAYSIGIFPMAEHRDDPDIFWVDPRRRGIIPVDGFHLSRSLARFMRRSDWTTTIDRAFDDVVQGCAARTDTWINDRIARLYGQLHEMGQAHSVEVWDGATLAGGVYGVSLGGAFFGESMFSNRTNGSKTALACLVDRLERGGYTLFDTQFLTEHLQSLGGVEISRDDYRERLADAITRNASFTAPPPATLQDVVQRMTQTS